MPVHLVELPTVLEHAVRHARLRMFCANKLNLKLGFDWWRRKRHVDVDNHTSCTHFDDHHPHTHCTITGTHVDSKHCSEHLCGSNFCKRTLRNVRTYSVLCCAVLCCAYLPARPHRHTLVLCRRNDSLNPCRLALIRAVSRASCAALSATRSSTPRATHPCCHQDGTTLCA
jgi:hypothetical protein